MWTSDVVEVKSISTIQTRLGLKALDTFGYSINTSLEIRNGEVTLFQCDKMTFSEVTKKELILHKIIWIWDRLLHLKSTQIRWPNESFHRFVIFMHTFGVHKVRVLAFDNSYYQTCPVPLKDFTFDTAFENQYI